MKKVLLCTVLYVWLRLQFNDFKKYIYLSVETTDKNYMKYNLSLRVWVYSTVQYLQKKSYFGNLVAFLVLSVVVAKKKVLTFSSPKWFLPNKIILGLNFQSIVWVVANST